MVLQSGRKSKRENCSRQNGGLTSCLLYYQRSAHKHTHHRSPVYVRPGVLVNPTPRTAEAPAPPPPPPPAPAPDDAAAAAAARFLAVAVAAAARAVAGVAPTTGGGGVLISSWYRLYPVASAVM
jgi:hypothetical protein